MDTFVNDKELKTMLVLFYGAGISFILLLGSNVDGWSLSAFFVLFASTPAELSAFADQPKPKTPFFSASACGAVAAVLFCIGGHGC